MNKIQKIVFQKKWNTLLSNYSVKDICLSLNFEEAMHNVEDLFYEDFPNHDNQQYALKLAFEIKDHFKNEWESDWKNDVFLGDLCDMLWRYDERYLCYKKAYDKLKDPPAELLLRLLNCHSTPDTPLITDEEAESYLRQALAKKLTSEVALSMRALYREKNNKSQENYWDHMYKKLEKENVHVDKITPNILMS